MNLIVGRVFYKQFVPLAHPRDDYRVNLSRIGDPQL